MNRDFPLHWYNWFENLPLIDVAKIENIFHSKTTNRWFVSNFGWNCAPIKSWQVCFSHDSQVASEFHSLFAFWSMLDMQPLQWRHIRVHPYCRQRKKQCLILFSLSAHFPVQDLSGDAENFFGTAHYRLCLLLCTFWTKSIMGSPKMCLGITHLFWE